MTLLPEQRDLALVAAVTALMWLPYTLAMILDAGLMATMGNREPPPALPAWAARARRAHANAIENLAVFAPLVLLATIVSPGATTVGMAARCYLIARIAHYLVYVAGLPVVRTLAFFAGWGATIAVAAALLA